MAANHLYSQLEDDEKKNLNVFFYVAADQDHPIHNSFKQRSCHIKLLIVDEAVAIQGSGNQGMLRRKEAHLCTRIADRCRHAIVVPFSGSQCIDRLACSLQSCK